MAKPIFLIKCPHMMTFEQMKLTTKNVEDKIGCDYHVLIAPITDNEFSFDCFNDCKGLRDDDITALIETINKTIQANEPTTTNPTATASL